jgi:hypothetical protein
MYRLLGYTPEGATGAARAPVNNAYIQGSTVPGLEPSLERLLQGCLGSDLTARDWPLPR